MNQVRNFLIGLIVLAVGAGVALAAPLFDGARAVIGGPTTQVTLADRAAAAIDQPAYDHFVFLPIVAKPIAPPPPPVRVELFAEPDTKTKSGNIVVDANGGLHVAYNYRLPMAENPAAVYLYCPGPAAVCADGAQWQGVSMLAQVDNVQLRLTAAGQPRLLIETNSQTYAGGRDIYYVECNQHCLTDPNAWSGTLVTARWETGGISDLVAGNLPRRSFALDPQGRPRFAYYDGNYLREPDHYGGYYAWCDVACADQANWYEVRITQQVGYQYESINFPALVFTADGRPRIATQVFPLGGFDLNGLHYYECDAACGSEGSWQRVKIADRGQGTYPMWDIELDKSDRPRVVFYKGQTLDSTGEKLYYLTCDVNCLTAGSWSMIDLGFGAQHGDGADLELDAFDRPRITYIQYSGEDLYYAWCNAACGNPASWQKTLVETNEHVLQVWPVANPFTCDAGFWDIKAPMFGLDAYGQSRATFDASYHARCWWDDPNDNQPPAWKFIEVWHTVRVLAFIQP